MPFSGKFLEFENFQPAKPTQDAVSAIFSALLFEKNEIQVGTISSL